jgi:hypothetical protein
MLRKRKGMTDADYRFFKQHRAAAHAIGLDKDIRFGPAWMFIWEGVADGEWNCGACGFINRALVHVRLSWGKKLDWPCPRARLSVEQSRLCVWSVYLERGKVFPGCENKMADLALFGQIQ